MSNNPYADDIQPNPYSFQPQNRISQDDGYIKQIPLLGVFTIVQASLELIMSFIIGGGAVFIAAMAKDPKFTQALGNSQVSPGFLVAIYAVLAVVIALIAALRMVAGIMTLYKRGRILTLTSAVVCLASVFTCYCSLTSIAVAIYTLVVLVQPSVIAEYERIRQER